MTRTESGGAGHGSAVIVGGGRLHRFVHATGVRCLLLEAADENLTCGIAFRTPAPDDSGVAHVLEHMVMSGSRRFPDERVGYEMRSRSVCTFMNAFTAQDCTGYLFSTRQRQDFENLLAVHLDAVLEPLLTHAAFEREAYRVVRGSSPRFQGVVLNEMKGRSGMPSYLLGQAVNRALFPGTSAARTHGGSVRGLLGLTLRDVRGYHAAHYGPANMVVFGYGDLPVDEFVEMLDRHLPTRAPRRGLHHPLARAPLPAGATVDVVERCPATFDASASQAVLAWRGPALTDPRRTLRMRFLSQVLVGSEAAPVREELLRQRLGVDLADASGYEEAASHGRLCIGTKGAAPDERAVRAVETTALRSLAALARGGVPREAVRNALTLFEMQIREPSDDRLPWGGRLFFHLLPVWLNGGDPVQALRIDVLMDELTSDATRAGFLEDLIARELLANGRRAAVRLLPDPAWGRELREWERRRLAGALRSRAHAVAPASEAPPGAALPSVSPADLDPRLRPAAYDVRRDAAVDVAAHARPGAAVLHVSSQIDASGVPREHLPLLALYALAVSAPEPRSRIGRRILDATGGVSAVPVLAAHPADPQEVSLALSLNGRALVRTGHALPGLMVQALLAPELDPERLRSLLERRVASFETEVGGRGHVHALRLATAPIRRAARLREILTGFEFYRRARELARAPGEELELLAERLEAVRAGLLRGRVQAFVSSAPEELAPTLEAALHAFGAFGGAPRAAVSSSPQPTTTIAIESPVAYNAAVLPTVPYAHEDAPALAVLARVLHKRFLWREVRERGGAYGVFCDSDPELGILRFASYRDPHTRQTFAAFERACAPEVVSGLEPATLSESIIDAFRSLDPPLSAHTRAAARFFQAEAGYTAPAQEAFRRKLLAVTRDDVARVAAAYLGAPASRASLAPPELLEQIGGPESP